MEDGTVRFIRLEHLHHPARRVAPNHALWTGAGEWFWIKDMNGNRWPGSGMATPWRERERYNGIEGWPLGLEPQAEQALNIMRELFPEKQWRLVEFTITQERKEITPSLAALDC